MRRLGDESGTVGWHSSDQPDDAKFLQGCVAVHALHRFTELEHHYHTVFLLGAKNGKFPGNTNH